MESPRCRPQGRCPQSRLVLCPRPRHGVFPCWAGVLNPDPTRGPPGELERSSGVAGAAPRPAGLRPGRGGPEGHQVDSEPSAGPGGASGLGENPPFLSCLIHFQAPGTLARAPRLRASLAPQRPWARLYCCWSLVPPLTRDTAAGPPAPDLGRVRTPASAARLAHLALCAWAKGAWRQDFHGARGAGPPPPRGLALPASCHTVL